MDVFTACFKKCKLIEGFQLGIKTLTIDMNRIIMEAKMTFRFVKQATNSYLCNLDLSVLKRK